MPDTTFQSKVTRLTTEWLQEVNNQTFGHAKTAKYYGITPGVDSTTQLETALADLATKKGTLIFGPGTYYFSSLLQVEPGVNLGGEGIDASVLQADDAAAGIAYVRGSNDGRGGITAGLTIHGGNKATELVNLGVVVERLFLGVDIKKAKTDNLVLEGTQNCTFVGVGVQCCEGFNVVFDLGAGNNRFDGAEINRAGSHNVVFRQSGTSPSGAFTVPSGNRFQKSVIERLGWQNGDFAHPDTGGGLIWHQAGRYNGFHQSDFGLEGLTVQRPMFAMDKPGAAVSTLMELCDITWSGTAPLTSALEVRAGTDVIMTGRHTFENHATALAVADTGRINGIFTPTFGNVTNIFGNIAPGTQPLTNLILAEIRSRQRIKTPAGSPALSLQSSTQDWDSLNLYPQGVIEVGDGTAAADLRLQRASLYGILGWKMTTPAGSETAYSLQVGPSAILVGPGVPDQPATDGTLYIRTGGNGELYQRRSGSWVAVT